MPEKEEVLRCCVCDGCREFQKVFTLFDGEGICFHGNNGVLVMFFSNVLGRSGVPVREHSPGSVEDAEAWCHMEAADTVGCDWGRPGPHGSRSPSVHRTGCLRGGDPAPGLRWYGCSVRTGSAETG